MIAIESVYPPLERDPFRSGVIVKNWRFSHPAKKAIRMREKAIIHAKRSIPVSGGVQKAIIDAEYSTDIPVAGIDAKYVVASHVTPEYFAAMLQKTGRIETADRIRELISICEEDEDENYRIDSLKAITHFFLGIPAHKSVSDICVSPEGTFIAEWTGSDGKILVAMEFLGDKVLLVRKVEGRAKASQVDPSEAQSYLP